MKQNSSLLLNKVEKVVLSKNIVKEIIIVDDYSTDTTLEFIKAFISAHFDLSKYVARDIIQFHIL